MKIFVGSLSFNTSEDELQREFEAFGKVDSVKIVLDRDTLKSRGFAFITMPEQNEAAAAIAGLNGKELKGFSLRVNEARPLEGQASRARETDRTAHKSSNPGGLGANSRFRAPSGGFNRSRTAEVAGSRDLDIYDSKSGRSDAGRGKKRKGDGSRRSGGRSGGGGHFH